MNWSGCHQPGPLAQAVACPGGYWADRPWTDGYGRYHPTMWFCP